MAAQRMRWIMVHGIVNSERPISLYRYLRVLQRTEGVSRDRPQNKTCYVTRRICFTRNTLGTCGLRLELRVKASKTCGKVRKFSLVWIVRISGKILVLFNGSAALCSRNNIGFDLDTA